MRRRRHCSTHLSCFRCRTCSDHHHHHHSLPPERSRPRSMDEGILKDGASGASLRPQPAGNGLHLLRLPLNHQTTCWTCNQQPSQPINPSTLAVPSPSSQSTRMEWVPQRIPFVKATGATLPYQERAFCINWGQYTSLSSTRAQPYSQWRAIPYFGVHVWAQNEP